MNVASPEGGEDEVEHICGRLDPDPAFTRW